MSAVLQMNPPMGHGQWLLITLTACVWVAACYRSAQWLAGRLLGFLGTYTFMSHLKWSWAIALGYIANIYTHLWINVSNFSQ